MHYLPPYAKLRERLRLRSVDGQVHASAKLDEIEDFVRSLLMAIPVDEEWYRKTYPDIDSAVKSGLVTSGRAHFIRDGYFEGRRPFEMTPDEAWYLAEHRDIAAAIAAGTFASASEHFASHGYAEGRLPFGPV